MIGYNQLNNNDGGDDCKLNQYENKKIKAKLVIGEWLKWEMAKARKSHFLEINVWTKKRKSTERKEIKNQ